MGQLPSVQPSWGPRAVRLPYLLCFGLFALTCHMLSAHCHDVLHDLAYMRFCGQKKCCFPAQSRSLLGCQMSYVCFLLHAGTQTV